MSITAESIMSRLQQITHSQLVQNYKPLILVDITPVQSQISSEFIIHFQENKLFIRALQKAQATKQIQSSQALIQTPLSTKDFVIHFHTPIVDQCKIHSVHYTKQTKQETLFVIVNNGVDNQLFRIPLKFFQFQISQSQQIQNFQFALRANELPQLTRFIDNFKDMSLVIPISADYLIGFDRKSQQICVFSYSETHLPIQKFKHTSVQHSRMIEPQKICVDVRGAVFSKTSGILQSVSLNKSSVLLIYDKLAAIDLWEYFMPGKQQNFLNLREFNPNLSTIKSRFSYLKVLYPLTCIPKEIKLYQEQLFCQFQSIQYKQQKQDEQFLFVYSIPFKGILNEDYNQVADKQMDNSMISQVPLSIFQENNVFLFSSKKFMAAANVDYRPDIITLSQCNQYIFVGSTESNIVTVLRIEQEKNGFSLAHSKVIVHPNAGAKLTSILSSPNWLVMLDAEDQVFTYNEDTSQNSTALSLFCGDSFGTLHLPKIDKIQDRKVNQSISIKELDKSSLNKSVHFESEQLAKRKINTRIPNIENFMQSSLFSPKAELASRVLTSAVGQSSNFQALASTMKPIDDMLSNIQVKEVQEKFKQYFNHYKIMRTIDEYVFLCININIPDEEIQHLDSELVNFMRANADNIRITQCGANYDFGSVEFLYNEISFINPKLIHLFGPVRDEFNIDFSQIDSIRLFFSSKSTETRFLSQMHHLLDTQINFLEISEAKICEILELELQDNQNKDLSLMDLLSQKIDQMVDYFQKCCLYQIGGLAALMQAIRPTNPNSMQSITSTNKSDTSSSMDSFSSKNLGQIMKGLQYDSERQFKAFDEMEQKLLDNNIDLSGLPIIEQVRNDNSFINDSKLMSQATTQNIIDRTKLSNYEHGEKISDPIISTQHQKLIKNDTHQGEEVQDISQVVEIIQDNDVNNNIDQYEIIEFHVRGENDDEDGEYVTEDIIEEEIIEYYDSDTEENHSVDLELNEDQKKRISLDLDLPQRPPLPQKNITESEAIKNDKTPLQQNDLKSPIVQTQQDSIQFLDDMQNTITNIDDVIIPVMTRIQKQNTKYENIQYIKNKIDQQKILTDLVKRISENFNVKKNKLTQIQILQVVRQQLGLDKVSKSPNRKDSSQLIQDTKLPDISVISGESMLSPKKSQNILNSPIEDQKSQTEKENQILTKEQITLQPDILHDDNTNLQNVQKQQAEYDLDNHQNILNNQYQILSDDISQINSNNNNNTDANSKNNTVDNNTDANSKNNTVDNNTDINSKNNTVDNKTDINSKNNTVDNNTDANSKNNTVDNKTDINSKNNTVDNNTDANSKNNTVDNNTDANSKNNTVDNKTDINSKNNTVDNKTDANSKNNTVDNNTDANSKNNTVDNNTDANSKNNTVDNNTDANSKNNTVDNKTDINSKNNTVDNKTDINSKNNTVDNKTDINSKNNTVDNKTDANSKNNTVDNKTDANSKNNTVDNNTDANSKNNTVDNKTDANSKNNTVDNNTDANSKNNTVDNKTDANSKNNTVDNNTDANSKNNTVDNNTDANSKNNTVDNNTDINSKNNTVDNKTDINSKNNTVDNKTDANSKNNTVDNKTDINSKNNTVDNKTDANSKNNTVDNKTDANSKNNTVDNNTDANSKNNTVDNKTDANSKNNTVDNNTDANSKNNTVDNNTDANSKNNTVDNKTDANSKNNTVDNNTDANSKNNTVDNNTDANSKNNTVDNNTDINSKNNTVDNNTDANSKNNTVDNNTDANSKNNTVDNNTDANSKNNTVDNKTDANSKNNTVDNKTDANSKNNTVDNKTDANSNEQEKQSIFNKLKSKFLGNQNRKESDNDQSEQKEQILKELITKSDSLGFSDQAANQLTVDSLQKDVEQFNDINSQQMSNLQSMGSPIKNYTTLQEKQKLNDQLLQEIMLRSQQYSTKDNSATSMLLSQQAVDLMTGEIDQTKLVDQLTQDSNQIKSIVDDINNLQGYTNKFFETQLIQNRRQSTFRQDLLGIRQGQLPKNDLMSSFYSTVGTQGIGSAFKTSSLHRGKK